MVCNGFSSVWLPYCILKVRSFRRNFARKFDVSIKPPPQRNYNALDYFFQIFQKPTPQYFKAFFKENEDEEKNEDKEFPRSHQTLCLP